MSFFTRTITRSALAGALLVGAPALVPRAVGQVTVSPATVEASVPAGQQGEVELAVTNGGAAQVDLFTMPLPEEGMPKDVGKGLFATEPGEVNSPLGMVMTPDGRIFAADDSGHRTWEYSLDLVRLRLIEEHPHTNNASRTLGLAWMPPEHAPPGYDEGTLWWMDVAIDCDGPHCTVESTLLLEGELDGTPTGRTVELVTGPGLVGPPLWYDRGVPLHLTYDAEAAGGAGLFYYVDWINEDLYAISVDGEVAEKYPAALIDYDPNDENDLYQAGLDATRGAGGGRYLDVGVVLPGEDYRDARVAVTDRRGRATGVETPLTRIEPPDGYGHLIRVMGVLRSRLDPSVMYLSVITGVGTDVSKWIVAIRAAPLPPRWLRASPVAPLSLTLAPGEADTLTVRLDTEGMAPGVYQGQVSLREGGPSGEEAASVPVTLTVTEGTAVEPGAPQPDETLRVWPNPVAGRLHVEADAHEAVLYDVLGRAVLHARLGDATEVDVSGLPPGVYVVRAGGQAAVITVGR